MVCVVEARVWVMVYVEVEVTVVVCVITFPLETEASAATAESIIVDRIVMRLWWRMNFRFVLMLPGDQNVCLQSLIALNEGYAMYGWLRCCDCTVVDILTLFVWLCTATSSRRSGGDLI